MMRKSFEGVWNVVRFNWHFYAVILILIIAILLISTSFSNFYRTLSLTLVFLMIVPLVLSLLITHYIYDQTDLYKLKWLQEYKDDIVIANFNAGFDETTFLIKEIKPTAVVIALDFYDEKKHTEVSIKRARKAYPQIPGTLSVKTNQIPLKKDSIDLMIGFLSIHEIRNEAERINFLKQLKDILKVTGEIIIIEHLRDIPNFLAYTIGFLHFHSKTTWLASFKEAGFITQEEKINPFMSKFKLSYGTTT